VAWRLTYGSIPQDLLVLHRCDNPPCVRPTHLFLGTYKDNADDMMAKGRYVSGRQKLTNAQVVQIRRNYVPYVVTAQMLAEAYGVSKPTIISVLRGYSFKKITSCS
jgi:hypothetical protein